MLYPSHPAYSTVTTTRPALDDVLKAMDAVSSKSVIPDMASAGRYANSAQKITSAIRSHDRGRIYAREIRPLLTQAGHPDQCNCYSCVENALRVFSAASRFDQNNTIKAANALGTLSGVLVTQRCLDLMKWELPILSRTTADFSAEPILFGETVDTRLRSIPGVTNYDPVDGYEDSDATDTDVSIVINKHKAVQVVFNANDLASTKRLLFQEQEEGMHFALGYQMMSDLLALATPANFPGATPPLYPGAVIPSVTNSTVDTMSRKTVIAMKMALSLRQITGGMRTLLLNSLYHGALENDISIVGNIINPNSGDSISEGTLPKVGGFIPFEAPFLPSNGCGLEGIGFRADAFAIASRPPNDYSKVFPGVTGGGVVESVTNPDTGFTVMLAQFLDHQLGQTRMRIAVMYGVAVGTPFAAQLLVGNGAPIAV